MRIPTPCLLVPVLLISVATILFAAERVGHTKDPLSKVKEGVDEETAVLLDVREKREWDSGHVEGAIFLPLSQLRDGVTQAELEKLPEEKVIYVHCKSGGRCLIAGKILSEHGYDIRPLKPGYEALISAGFPKAKP